MSSGVKRGEYQLPDEWLNVSGNTNTVTLFDLDLCPTCKGVVLDAAGQGKSKGKRLRSVG